MREKSIKILKLENGEPPKVLQIANTLKAMQNEVQGLIECVYLDDGNIAIINEEGKINGMEPNRRVGSDIICGPFFICGDDGEHFKSLPEQDIEKYTKKFAEIEQFSGKERELEPKATVIGFDFHQGM